MLNLISETLRPKKFDQLVLEKQLIDKLQKILENYLISYLKKKKKNLMNLFNRLIKTKNN